MIKRSSTWSRLDEAYANGQVVGYRIRYQLQQNTSTERVCRHKFKCMHQQSQVVYFCAYLAARANAAHDIA